MMSRVQQPRYRDYNRDAADGSTSWSAA